MGGRGVTLPADDGAGGVRGYPYVNSFIDRHGRRRYYFRRFGRRTPLPGAPGAEEFERAYAEALKASLSVAGVGADRAAGPRSMAALVRCYRASPAYLGCKESTRRSYDQQLREIEATWGKFPADRLTRGKVNELMANRAHDPKRANRLHKRLRAVMELAVDMGWVEVNPVGSRRPYRPAVDGHPPWPDAEIAKFHARWKRGTRQRLAFDLLLYLGQRSVDTVAMARNHIEAGRIRVTQEKTGAALWIALHRDLRATLEAGPVGGLYLVETEAGGPRTVKGFYNWIKDAARAARCAPRLSPHGLRKSAATRLIDAGASAAEAAAVTGHKSLAELERYIKARNQVRLADAAIRKLERNKNGS